MLNSMSQAVTNSKNILNTIKLKTLLFNVKSYILWQKFDLKAAIFWNWNTARDNWIVIECVVYFQWQSEQDKRDNGKVKAFINTHNTETGGLQMQRYKYTLNAAVFMYQKKKKTWNSIHLLSQTETDLIVLRPLFN